MTFFTLNAFSFPLPNHTGHSVHVGFGIVVVARSVTTSTVIGSVFFTSMIGNPTFFDNDITSTWINQGEVILGSRIFITSDDVAVVVNKASFPRKTADDKTDVVPCVAFGTEAVLFSASTSDCTQNNY